MGNVPFLRLATVPLQMFSLPYLPSLECRNRVENVNSNRQRYFKLAISRGLKPLTVIMVTGPHSGAPQNIEVLQLFLDYEAEGRQMLALTTRDRWSKHLVEEELLKRRQIVPAYNGLRIRER